MLEKFMEQLMESSSAAYIQRLEEMAYAGRVGLEKNEGKGAGPH